MNPTLFEISAGVIMVAVVVGLVVWVLKSNAATSKKRMLRMLTRAGVDPEVAMSGDTEAIMRDVQSRCLGCRSEALCERWLAERVEGDNDFCPNAPIFRSLAKTDTRTAA
jgi:hypothetical protein